MQNTTKIVQSLAQDWLNSLHRRQRRRVALWQTMADEPPLAVDTGEQHYPECPPACETLCVTKAADPAGICDRDNPAR